MTDHYIPPTTATPPRSDEELVELLETVESAPPYVPPPYPTFGSGIITPPDPRPAPDVPIWGGQRLTPDEIDALSPNDFMAYQQSLAIRSNGGLFGAIGPDSTISPGLADTIGRGSFGGSGGGGISEFDQALLESVGYRPGSPGSPARQVVDQQALAAQQDAIQQTLDATLAHIADQFQTMQGELDRQRQAGLDEIERARSQALESLTGLRSDFATRSDRVDAQILESIARTSGGIREGADDVLRDLEAQGASAAGVQEAIAAGVSQAESQGQIQADLVNRLQEINDAFLGRNLQTTENISQGATSQTEQSFASLLAGLTAQRGQDEFSANEQARQALLQLALNPPQRTIPGSRGTPAGGVLNEADTLLFRLALQQGMSGEQALADILEGRPLFDPLPPQEAPSVDDIVTNTILGNEEILQQVVDAEIARRLE